MRRVRFHPFSLAGLALVLAAAGCGGGSSAVTGPDEAPSAGSAVIAGTVVGGGVAALSTGDVHALSGGGDLTVSVEGTGIHAAVDEEGEFALFGVPAGTVTLLFEGPGINARLTVSGILDGQVMSLQVHLSGTNAQTTAPPSCSPTKEVKFIGILESKSGERLVVAGRPVDVSQIQKVWRNGRRTTLESLQVGEKVKVWGTQRADGVVVAAEIEARDLDWSPEGEKVRFRGRVQSVTVTAFDGVDASCHRLTLVVAGRTVKTTESTSFKWSDGTALDPSQIRVGDMASIEGVRKSGHIQATKVKIDCR